MKPACNLETTTRAVLWNSMLWTAGHALTTGGFLTYFTSELDASFVGIAVLMAAPEMVGIVALWSRLVIKLIGDRKRTWLVCSIIGCVATLGIPLLAFPAMRPEGIEPVWIVASCVAVAHAAHAIAFVAYLSWLSDLVPDRRWGRFFAMRQIATLMVLLVVPVTAGYARQHWRNHFSQDQALLAYVVIFVLGIGLLLCSLLPMLRLPTIAVSIRRGALFYRGKSARGCDASLPGMMQALKDRQFRKLCGYSWWLAFWSGLTQVVVFKFLYGPLAISLGTYYLLSGIMKLVQIPVCWGTGIISDRFGNKTVLGVGVLATALAMPFFCLASISQWWWVLAAYVMWGGWGAVNIAAPNLMLKLSPPSDNAAHIALFRHVAGLVAGMSGILGGYWLGALTDTSIPVLGTTIVLDRYQLLFLVSFVGRVLTIFWILPICEPPASSSPAAAAAAANEDSSTKD